MLPHLRYIAVRSLSWLPIATTQLLNRGDFSCFVDSSIESRIIDRILVGEAADGGDRLQNHDSAATDYSPTAQPTGLQSASQVNGENVPDNGPSLASEPQARQMDPVLLQIAQRYSILAHDSNFNQAYPLTAGLIREFAGIVPLRPSTPDVLAVLRDIWGQIRPPIEMEGQPGRNM